MKNRSVGKWVLLMALATIGNKIIAQENPEDKLGWKIGVQTVSWGLTPLSKEFVKADSAKIKYLEGIVVQPISETDSSRLNWDLTAAQRKEVVAMYKKADVALASIGVVNPPDKAGYIKLFELARDLGLSEIATEPAPELLPMVAMLAKKYKIKTAIHNHPYPSFYFQPDSLIKYFQSVKGNEYIGACADIGHWVRSGYDAVASLKQYQAAGIPIFEVHFKDMNEWPSAAYTQFMRSQPVSAWDFKKYSAAPPAPHDVPWGTGISNIKGVVRQLMAMNFKGYLFSEYEFQRGANTPLIAESVQNLRSMLQNMEHETNLDQALLVVNNKANTLSVINPKTNEVIKVINVGVGPHEVAASDDGNYAFTSNYGGTEPGKTLSVVDMHNLTEIKKVDLGVLRKPHGLGFSHGKLYFTAEVNKIMGIYDPKTGEVVGLIGTGQDLTHALMIDEKKDRIFTSNVLSNSVNVYEHFTAAETKKFNLTPGEYKTSVISVGTGPHGLGLSPDGNELWVTNTRDSTLSVVDLITKKEVARLHSNFIVPKMLTVTDDGKLVFIAEREGDLVVFDRVSRKEIKRFKVSDHGGVGMVLLSPDNKTAYVTAADHIVVIDVTKLEQVTSISLQEGLDGMSWYKGN